MKRRSAWLLCLIFFAPGCGPADPHDARFKAAWRHTVENGLTNTKEETLVRATVDHDLFRTSEKSGGGDYIEVFDGKTLFTKSVPATVDAFALPPETPVVPDGAAPLPASESAQPMTVTQTGSRRFWSSTARPGHGEPGGTIAGQDTLLYQAADHRADGDLSTQEWIDAKTGVLLKSVNSIYSSQVRSMVRQETWECQSIDYSPPDPSVFQKP